MSRTIQMLLRPLLFSAMAFAALDAWAQVTVSQAWVQRTVPGQDSSGAYMSLKSAGDAVLKGVDTPLAAKAEIHEMRMDGNIMRMRALPQLGVPAGKTVELSPQGDHIMLTGLKKPLAKGDKVPLKLHFVGRDGKAQDVVVQAEVRDPAVGGMDMKH